LKTAGSFFVANNQLTINEKLKAEVTVGSVMSTSTVVPEVTGSNIIMLSPDASSIQHSKTINGKIYLMQNKITKETTF
jgi:predicted fused transcriptional regulator/phosphomethylpyrimidine kinase